MDNYFRAAIDCYRMLCDPMQYFLTSTGWVGCYVRKDKFNQRLAVARSFAPRTIARARQAGDLRLPGLHLHLRHRAPRRLPGPAEEPARPRAGEARGDQGGVAATAAPADPRPGALAEAGRDRLLRLPRRADQRSRPGGVPLPRPRPVAAHAAPPQPEG